MPRDRNHGGAFRIRVWIWVSYHPHSDHRGHHHRHTFRNPGKSHQQAVAIHDRYIFSIGGGPIDLIASEKPSWIVMVDIAFVSAHWRPSATSALTSSPVVTSATLIGVLLTVADKNSCHDIFAIPHHRGVGSDTGDN